MSCPSAASAEPERDVDIVAWLRHGLLQFRGCFLEALHLEADVMNAAPALASLVPAKVSFLKFSTAT